MNDIEIGEYVRTNDGNIGRFDYISKDGKYLMLDIQSLPLEYCEVKKHSKNIIDVLEVGDIVSYTIWILPDSFEDYTRCIYDVSDMIELATHLSEEDITINSILTHEQYKSNAYRMEK